MMRIGKVKVRPADVAQVGLFSALPDAELERIVSRASTCHFSRGDCVLRQGERSEQIHLIVSGAFKVSSLAASGQGITLSIMGRHEIFGEMAFLDGQTHSANVSAVCDSCTLRIANTEFAAMSLAYSQVADHLARSLALRLRRLSQASERLAAEDVSVRLARQLIDLAERFGGREPNGVRISLGLSQRELAELVGASRERVNRVLATWVRQGSLSIHGRDLIVHSPDQLGVSASAD